VGFRAASDRARDQNSGALKGFLSASGEKFPDIGKFKHKNAVLRDCEKPQRGRRRALLTERPIHQSRSPRLAREQDKIASAEQRAEAAKKQPAELEEEVADLHPMVHTGGTPY
jgi:hypothetical protein